MKTPRHLVLTALVALCSLALLAPLAWPLTEGKIFVYSDLATFHLPMRYLYQEAMRHGDTVLWTPSIYGGLYLLGEGQAGLFHPLHQLLCRLLPLVGGVRSRDDRQLRGAFAGWRGFSGGCGSAGRAALFGAMLFAFSGFNLLHHQHLNMVAVVARCTWLLAAADSIGDRGRPARRPVGCAGRPGGRSWDPSSSLASRRRSWNLLTLAAFRCADATKPGAGGSCRWYLHLPSGSGSSWAASSAAHRRCRHSLATHERE
jgi:hypothetical protein